MRSLIPFAMLPAAIAVAAPAVEMLRFLPMLPPLAPGTAAQPLIRLEGGALAAPVWLPELQKYAVLNDGIQTVVQPETATASALPDAMTSHAHLSGVSVFDPDARSDSRDANILVTALVACDSATRSLRCITVDPSYLVPVPLEGVADLSALTLVFALSEDRLLVATDDGRLLCLSGDEKPATLLTLDGDEGPEPGTLRGACVTDDEKTLFLCDDLDVYRCALDLGDGVCSAPAMLPQLEASLGSESEVTGIACDVNGNLYVSASEGVIVVDETGDVRHRDANHRPWRLAAFS